MLVEAGESTADFPPIFPPLNNKNLTLIALRETNTRSVKPTIQGNLARVEAVARLKEG